jgi:hypothetical protein
MAYQKLFRVLSTVVTVFALTRPGFAAGQRLTDDDVKELMEGIEKDVERFNDAIDSKYQKSTIRSATSEVSIETFTKDLEENAKKMRQRFDSDYSASNEVLGFLKQAQAIDSRAASGATLFGAEKEWPRLKGSLERLAGVYGIDWKSPSANWAARRINDRELEGVLSGLESSGETFKKSLETAMKKADLAGGERKVAMDSADQLVRSTKELKKTVKDGKDAAGELGLIHSSFTSLQSLVAKYGLTGALAPSWAPLEAGLQKISGAFK